MTTASKNPATGEDWATFACAAPLDLDRAIAVARRVLDDPAWRDMTQTQRGKLLAEAATQSAYVGDCYRYYAGLADKIEGTVLPIDKPDMHVLTWRGPIVVVVAIVPWNAQMFPTATKLGSALVAVCSVVLKASESTLAAACAGGARVRFGGARVDKPGNYLAPTLVECSDGSIETLKTEMFGPVMSLLPFGAEEEAIVLTKATPFGLESGVFTQNVARAHRVSARLKAGICWVNTNRAVSPVAPFGCYDQSGYGRETEIDAMLDYTRAKSTRISTSDTPMANPFVMW